MESFRSDLQFFSELAELSFVVGDEVWAGGVRGERGRWKVLGFEQFLDFPGTIGDCLGQLVHGGMKMVGHNG